MRPPASSPNRLTVRTGQPRLQGLLVQSKTVAPGNIVLEQQDVDWRVAEGPTSDGTPRLFRSTRSATTNKKDLNGAFISHGNEAIFYDDGAGDQFANYGFPRRIKVTTYGSASDSVVVGTKTTDNTYDHTESNWRLGRLRSATVTHQESGLPDLVRSSAFTYDNSKGVLASETVEPGSPLFYTKTYGYNSFGAINTMTETWGNQNRASIKNPDGTAVAERITRYAYDPRSRYKNRETNALDHTQDNAYDPVSGVLDSTTGPNGLTTTWGQDAFGRTTRENRADNTYTKTQRYRCGGTVSCPANAAIKIVTDVYTSDDLIAAPTETVYQDELYREVRKGTLSLDGREVDVDTIYDGQGRIKKKSEPFFAGAATVYWTTIQYDLIDRPVLTTRPDGSTQSVSYNGLTVTSTNELGQQKIVTKDALGRNARVTDDAGTAILYTYDALGELTQTRMAGIGNTASDYAYDVRGNKVSDSDPDKGDWTYEYNALGLVSSQTDANGKVTTMTYDILGRMKTRTDDATAPNPGNRRSTWTYDLEQDSSNAKGRLTQISGPGGYFKYIFYDNLQREKRVDETIEGTVYRTLTDYDTGSRVATVSYPSLYGQTSYKITNKYNGYGHLISVNDPGDAYLWRALADDARGNVTEFQLGAQVHSLRAYDNQRGWLKSIFSEKLSTHSVLQDLTYSFNTLGNLTRRADREFTANSLIEDILYDADLNRLKKSTVTQSGTGGWQKTVTVGYDTLGLGNIVSKSDVGTYTYGQAASGCGGIAGGKHAVTTIAGEKNATYCYDRNGNMLSGDGRTIAYTPYDLPQTITRGFSTVTFSYGPERARTKRVDSTAAGVTTTIYAAGRAYEKITRPDGSIEQKFYIGDPGSGPGASFAVVTRPGTSVTPTDTIKYLLGDHLGSVDVIANANGTLAQKMSFDAWGKRREPSWTVMIDPSQFDSTITTHGFTGHEEIDPVELVHMNGRVYDPEIGRFLSADPFVQDQSNSQSFNRYSYVLNNPLSLTDPTGFFFGSIFKAIGNFIGKVFSAIASVFKAVLKIPLIRAAVQIVACGSGVLAVCVGVSGAMELVAGGSIEDAIKAMAFAGGSYVTWSVVGGFTDLLGAGMGVVDDVVDTARIGFAAVKGAIHGVVGGALSLAQGGEFMEGFVANSVGAFAGVMSEGVFGPPQTGGAQGYIGRVSSAAIAGGTASELTGGKFANGAVTAAFAQMWNGEGTGGRILNPRTLLLDLVQEAVRECVKYDCMVGPWGAKEINGTRYWQNDELIDPDKSDAQGRTNLARMKDGLAPIGSDNQPLHLHHVGQIQNGPIAEVTATMHRDYYRQLHSSYLYGSRPGVNHGPIWGAQRSTYWRIRATDFE
jgi:RHS repeat-associated protein